MAKEIQNAEKTAEILFGNVVFEETDTTNIPKVDLTSVENVDDNIKEDKEDKDDKKTNLKQDKNEKNKPVNPLEDPNLVKYDIKNVLSNDDDTGDNSTEDKDKGINEDNKDNNPPADKNQVSSSPVSVFAKALAERGVFSEFTEEKFNKILEDNNNDPIEALIELNRETIARETEEYKKGLDSNMAEIAEAIESGVNMQEFIRLKQSENTFLSITPEKLKEDVVAQEKIVAELLRLRGNSKDEISEDIKIYKDINKLAEKAEKGYEILKKYHETEKTKLQQETLQKEKQQREYIQNLHSTVQKHITELDEIIPGIKLNKQSKEELYKSMTTIVGESKNGTPLTSVAKTRDEDPIKFETLLHYYHKIGLFSGKFDKFLTVMKSTATKDLHKILQSENTFKSNTVEKTPKSNDKVNKDLNAAFDFALKDAGYK